MILDNLIKWDYLINLSNTITHQVMSLVLRSLQDVRKNGDDVARYAFLIIVGT